MKKFIITLLACISLNVAAQEVLPIIKGVGGNFTADSTLGKKVSLSDYEDEIVLLTFGYTNCPDVCPVTLGYLTGLIRDLGKQQLSVTTLFTTVDPEYDSPQHLKKYLAYFNKDFIGLTGTQKEVDVIADQYLLRRQAVADLKVSTEYRKKKFAKDGVDKSQDKTKIFSHSTYIYLIDKKGRTRTFFDTGTTKAKVVEMVRSLSKE